MIFAVIVYLPILIFGSHLVRTLAFNRHEAITFESSSVTSLVALFLIWQYGPSKQRLLLLGVLIVMFTVNAFAQWFFYMKLQGRIKKAFEIRAKYLEGDSKNDNKRKKEKDYSVIESLKAMASVAIMPSFSRFIEESKYFNNPGNLIGLIKSIMKRQRFQKKKYLMRDCFAEILNLIGLCKPDIDDEARKNDAENNDAGPERKSKANASAPGNKPIVSGTIRSSDLALEGKHELAGLIIFDVMGFGALILMFIFLLHIALNGAERFSFDLTTTANTVLMFTSALLFTAFSLLLRHYGFARYESFFYELSFTALVIASFRVLALVIDRQPVSWHHLLILGASVAVFILLSCANKYLDKKLHKTSNKAFDDVIDLIPLDTETSKVKRRILKDLRTISEWSLVPFDGRKALDDLPGDNNSSGNYFKEFRSVNLKKRIIPSRTADLICRVAPEYDKPISKNDFILDDAPARIISDLVGAVYFIALFIFIGQGWI